MKGKHNLKQQREKEISPPSVVLGLFSISCAYIVCGNILSPSVLQSLPALSAAARFAFDGGRLEKEEEEKEEIRKGFCKEADE